MMMTEAEVLRFVEEVCGREHAHEAGVIAARWLADREEAAEEARDAIYDDAQDSWNGGDVGD